MGKIMIDNGTS